MLSFCLFLVCGGDDPDLRRPTATACYSHVVEMACKIFLTGTGFCDRGLMEGLMR